MSALPAARWALSPTDYRAHAVVPNGATAGVMVARCGHPMPREAGLDDVHRGEVCASCVLLVAPSFKRRGELLNAARDAEGLGEWFPRR